MFQNFGHGVKPIKIEGLQLYIKSTLLAVFVAKISVTCSYQTEHYIYKGIKVHIFKGINSLQ